MNPILVNRSEIDDAQWNGHIRQSLQCAVYAQAYYLDIVCHQWQALVWPSVNAYEIVMPLPIRRKLGFTILYQPHFCQFLGLFSPKAIKACQMMAFLQCLNRHFSYISTYHFNPENAHLIKDFIPKSPKVNFWLEQTYWLEIGNYQKVINGYSKDRIQNLKRSLQFNWNVNEGKDLIALIQLFRENHNKSIEGGVASESLERLRKLFQMLNAKGDAAVYYASLENQIHAGMLLVKSGQRVIFLFNAADATGRKGNARTWMLDQYFRNQKNGSVTFDFESPQVAAIAGFYKSFGSKTIDYYAIDKNQLPFPLRQIQRIRQRFYLKTRQCLYAVRDTISNPFQVNRF